MTATQKDELLARRLGIPTAAAATLRRAEMTLHRWAELECGDGNDYASWAIERDDDTGKPYMARYPHNGPASRTAIADRETGALRRVAATWHLCGTSMRATRRSLPLRLSCWKPRASTYGPSSTPTGYPRTWTV